MTTEWVDTLQNPTAYWDDILFYGTTVLNTSDGQIKVSGEGAFTEELGFSNIGAGGSSLLVGEEVLAYRIDVSFFWADGEDPGVRQYNLRDNADDNENTSVLFPGTGTLSREVTLSGPFFPSGENPLSLKGTDPFVGMLGMRYLNNNTSEASITITKLDVLLVSLLTPSSFWTNRRLTSEREL